MCLDLLRALSKSGQAKEVLAAELGEGSHADPDYVHFTSQLLADLPHASQDEFGARQLAERIVLAVQAWLLLRHAPAFVSSAFVATRLAREPGGVYGRLPAGTNCEAILQRALVENA
jgi:putative acyl-CoA dehydrogenase